MECSTRFIQNYENIQLPIEEWRYIKYCTTITTQCNLIEYIDYSTLQYGTDFIFT